ncbi:RNase H domain-containing protein [Abeliophyllum distichum]|uniref:RNase H domain-containing protein n=1 Tax=Abeliophyllum distichum TaxID=126358 RepID=A0ABD1QF98_9LAMI
MFMSWITNKQARPGSLLAAVPLIILWFLWIGRNNSRYNDVQLKAPRIIKKIHYMLESLLKARILNQITRNLPSPVAVTWWKPKEGWHKLNTDGALKENAELRAVETGLRQCWQNKLIKVWVEVDSLAAMLLCNQKNKGPWDVQYILESIHQNINKMEIHFSHIWREGNRVAD